jgi:chorismate synthase
MHGTLAAYGCSALTSVTVAGSIDMMNSFVLDFSGCSLDLTSVDAILAAVWAGIQAAGDVNFGTLNLSGGANATPTNGSSNSDYTSLTSTGITVSINTGA